MGPAGRAARVGKATRAAGGMQVNRGRPGAWPSSVSSRSRPALAHRGLRLLLLKNPEHLKGHTERFELPPRAQGRCEFLNGILGRHDLAEDGAVLLSKGNGDILVPIGFPIEKNVGEKYAHLGEVDLVDERVEGEVYGLHRIRPRHKHPRALKCREELSV